MLREAEEKLEGSIAVGELRESAGHSVGKESFSRVLLQKWWLKSESFSFASKFTPFRSVIYAQWARSMIWTDSNDLGSH